MSGFYAYIDGTDYGPNGLDAVDSVQWTQSGVDKNGEGIITLNFSASAGYTFFPLREVQVYLPPDTLGGPNLGLFGGFIKTEGIDVWLGPDGHTIVQLHCVDYNVIPDNVMLPYPNIPGITVASDTFDAQVADLVQQMQENGHGSVSHIIDATTYVDDIGGGHVFDSVFIGGGHSLRQAIRILINNALLAFPTIVPRSMMRLEDDGTHLMRAALVVYDQGALPGSVATFAEVPSGGEHRIMAHTRTFDASMPQANWMQGSWVDETGLTHWLTTTGDTSAATYYFPYQNDGLTGSKGYWKVPAVEDSQSANLLEAQLALDVAMLEIQYPRETLQVTEKDVYIKPGQTVHITTDNIDQDYEVTAVSATLYHLQDDPFVWTQYQLTCGLPLLDLFDTGRTAIQGPPAIEDHVIPEAPSGLTVDSNTYDWDTGHALISLTIGASPSPDTLGYKIVYESVSHLPDFDVGADLTPTIAVFPGEAFTLWAVAYDAARNVSLPSVNRTGTSAPIPNLAPSLQNPSFERVRADGTAYNWTVATVGSGTGTVDTTTAAEGHNSFHLATPSPSDEVLLTSDMFATRYLDGGDAGALLYLDLKMKRGSHNVNSIDIYVDWYDSSLSFIVTETVVSGLNLLATWSSYHYDLPWPGASPENVAAAVLRFHSQPMSGAYDWYIDSLQVEQPITPQRMVAATSEYGLHLPFDSGGGPLAPFSLPAVRIPVASQITGTHLLTQHGETMTASVGIWVNASQWPTVADLVTTLSMSATDHYDNTGLSIAVTAGSWLIANLASVSGSSVTQLSAALDLKKT